MFFVKKKNKFLKFNCSEPDFFVITFQTSSIYFFSEIYSLFLLDLFGVMNFTFPLVK